jgi:UDP-N-acetylmuramoylalanine-D-glutamate ligase
MKFLKENFLLQENWKLEQLSVSKKNLDVYDNIDDYIMSKQTTIKHCTTNVINAIKAHLKSFESHGKEPVTFDSSDVHFYEDIVKYLTYDIPQLRRKVVIKA